MPAGKLQRSSFKLINDIKSQSNTYCTRAMENQIRKTLLKIGIVKHYQTTFIMKELLGGELEANDDCEKDVLDRLSIIVELGEEVIVDSRKNNGGKPKFEDFWLVKLH